MKFHIVCGYEIRGPAKGSYNKSMVTVAKDFLEKKKHEVTVTYVPEGYSVDKEIQFYKDSDVIIFQYPVYWFTFPSTFKKYIDDVYQYGQFFEFTEKYGSGGLLKDKKYMLSTTWNAPASEFKSSKNTFIGKSLENALTNMHKINEYCGMKALTSFGAFDIVRNPKFNENVKRYEKHLEKILKDLD